MKEGAAEGMMDIYGYPTEEELQIIRDWDLTTQPVIGLLRHIKQCWNWADWGYSLTGKNVLRLNLHTGGWSGNEDVIRALKETDFWFLYWGKSIRGGHYYFRIPLTKRKVRRK